MRSRIRYDPLTRSRVASRGGSRCSARVLPAVRAIDFFELVSTLDVREPAKLRGSTVEWFGRDGRKRVCVARGVVAPLILWTIGTPIVCEQSALEVDPAVLRPCAETQAPLIAQQLATQIDARACMGIDVIEGRSVRYFAVESFARDFTHDATMRTRFMASLASRRVEALYRMLEPLARTNRRRGFERAAFAMFDESVMLRLAADWFVEDLAIAPLLREISSDLARSSGVLGQGEGTVANTVRALASFASRVESFARVSRSNSPPGL